MFIILFIPIATPKSQFSELISAMDIVKNNYIDDMLHKLIILMNKFYNQSWSFQ